MAKQVALMKQQYHHFDCRWKKNRAIWIGNLQPSPISEVYKVKIEYIFKGIPKVWVIHPKLLTRRNGERIPHTYSGNRLCLYLPSNKEWTRNQSIASTIVPWTSLWLYHYEVWHATGEWLGGGHGTPTDWDEEE